MDPISNATRAALFSGGLLVCLLMESLFPLRDLTQPKTPRVFRNLLFAAIGSLVARFAFLGILSALAMWSHQHRFGLLAWLHLRQPLHVVAGLLLMDYTFYFWHRWNHRLSFLWRFHNVHHTDLDLDVSTASRFHVGELTLSVPFRAAQIVLIGVDPFTWVLFETLVVAATQFHHSNIRLPDRIDRLFNWIIVTPRMHGLHHSQVRGETDSNYSTIFSFWDRIHRSFVGGLAQFSIGVPAYQNPEELTLWKLMSLPVHHLRPWRRSDGQIPTRHDA